MKDKIVKIVMQEKLNEAYAEYRSSRYKDNRTWDECKKLITGAVRRRYLGEWQMFVRNVKKKLDTDEHMKVEWLLSKWKRKAEDVPEVFEGVKIKDDGEFPPEFNNEPRMYGGVVVNDVEKAALMLPPKFGLLEDISVTKCRIQLEEAINKLRWNKIIDNDRQIKDVNLYDVTTKTMDINTLKVTSLPFNPGVRMPWSLKRGEEVKIEKFKGEVMTAVKQMKGKNKDWSNLSVEEKAGMASMEDRVRQRELVCCVTDKSSR